VVNQAFIQQKIWYGDSKAAQILGASYNFTRPVGTPVGSGNVPLETNETWSYPGTALFSRNVSLNAQDMTYKKPNGYGKPLWFGLFDGTGLQPGDYLAGPQGTFFIAAIQPLLPILVVECNRVISLFRPQAQTGIGKQAYGGTTISNQREVVSGVPCSILQGTKGEKSEAQLPGDTRSAWWTILIPSSVCRVLPDDILTDDIGLRYVISSVELTDLGYRLTGMFAIT
jgi:hypothetical protein